MNQLNRHHLEFSHDEWPPPTAASTLNISACRSRGTLNCGNHVNRNPSALSLFANAIPHPSSLLRPLLSFSLTPPSHHTPPHTPTTSVHAPAAVRASRGTATQAIIAAPSSSPSILFASNLIATYLRISGSSGAGHSATVSRLPRTNHTPPSVSCLRLCGDGAGKDRLNGERYRAV